MPDSVLGVQLVRDFTLDEGTSRLICKQTIKNISNETKRWGYWGRTAVAGGGIAIVPLNPSSRFTKQYIIYGPGRTVNFNPGSEPNVQIKDGCCLITGQASQDMLGFDGYQGWLAYLSRNDLLFIKRFPTYQERVYDGVAPITTAVYYWKDLMCELEPVGPKETIKPGASVSFTEEWYLLPYEFQENTEQVDMAWLKSLITLMKR
jgi:hypothetical protein